MGIKHRADSGFRKFSALSKVCLGGQVNSFEVPYVSYPRPLAKSEKTETQNENKIQKEKITHEFNSRNSLDYTRNFKYRNG